jgi:serine/threonine protein kinase
VVGTLKYIPPEVVAGQPTTPRSDLYSCGVVLGECLAVSPSRSLRKVADQLAADDPELRPSSAGDAITMLERLTAQTVSRTTETLELRRGGSDDFGASPALPPSLERSTMPWHLRRWFPVAESRRALAAAVVVAVAIVVTAIVAIAGDSGGRSGEEQQSPRALRSAPLEEQLDALDRAVREAARR